MANDIKWGTLSSASTLLSTELNLLADAAKTALGAEYDNSTSRNQYGWLEVYIPFASAPTDGKTIEIYLIKCLDGTNYEDGSSSVRPSGASLAATIDVTSVASAQRRTSHIIQLPPCKFKALAISRVGATLPSSGNTVKLYFANDQIQ